MRRSGNTLPEVTARQLLLTAKLDANVITIAGVVGYGDANAIFGVTIDAKSALAAGALLRSGNTLI